MNDTSLTYASITEIAGLFRRRKLSPVELTELMLARIERVNPVLNAFITISADEARSQAKKAEVELSGVRARKAHGDRGLLHGIPISLKDNIFTEGIRTTAGSRILRDFVPDHDAVLVKRLKKAGAVILGKTNMHEFAYGVTTNNPHYGAAKNPWDRSRICGGSSGGSAAAVAAGLCYGSIGTDTGGSIRIPAALCGVVGLKTTLNAIDSAGVIPLSVSLDCVGPITRTATDGVIILQAMGAGGRNLSSPEKIRKSSPPLAKIRLGLPREFFFDVISAEVQASFNAALESLRRLGAGIKDITIPLLKATETAGNRIAWAEATHYHQQSGWFSARAREYGEDVRTRLEAGTKVSATQYLEALDQQKAFIAQLQSAMQDASVDALVVPTTPITAPLLDEETTRVEKIDYPTRALLLSLNRPANLAGVPAISMPCGLSMAGLPVGLQLIGAAHSEDKLLRIASSYESECTPSAAPVMMDINSR